MRPANLQFGVDDRPPLAILLLSALQHVALFGSLSMVTLMTMLDATAVPLAVKTNLVSIAFLGLGATTVAIALRTRRFGAGYLVCATVATPYVAVGLAALRTHSLAEVFGMTIFGGLVTVALSFGVRHMRRLLPPEISGITVMMIGLSLGTAGFRLMFGPPSATAASASVAGDLEIAGLTLAVMVGLSIWTSGITRYLCVLFGIAVGSALAAARGRFDFGALTAVHGQVFALPTVGDIGPAFAPDLVVPYAIAGLAVALGGVADFTTSQKVNDTDWQRPDFASIGGGILALGVMSVLNGLLGTVGVNTAASSIGMSVATGITSRVVAFAVGAMFAALAVMPEAAAALLGIPDAVKGAVLLFSGALVLVSGLQIVMTRSIDMRKTFVIGISVLVAISRDVFPFAYANPPPWLQPFVLSSTVLGIVTAIVLNLVFRIGVRSRVALRWQAGRDSIQALYDWVQRNGARWSPKEESLRRATQAVLEFGEMAPALLREPEMQIRLASEHDGLQAEIAYRGRRFEPLAERPSAEALLAPGDDVPPLARHIVTRSADRIEVTERGGRVVVRMEFL